MTSPASPLKTAARAALKLAVIFLFIVALMALIDWAMDETEAFEQGAMPRGLLLAALLLAYAILLSVPFVPGVEIGLALLASEGAIVAPAVYGATVLGLSMAYLAGRYLSPYWLARRLRGLRLMRAAQIVEDTAPLGKEARLQKLHDRIPNRIADYALRYRYVMLAVLLNLPGSALIGGGGGICLIAGMTRLFSGPAFALTIALAVAPAPLIVWAAGWSPG